MNKNKLAVMCAIHNDPYQILYYKELFKKYWGNEVGGLYALISGDNYLNSAKFNVETLKEVAEYVDYVPDLNDHGTTLNRLYKQVPKDKEVVMIMDSDEWIYKPGLITDFLSSFDEGTDIVGDWCDSGSEKLKDKAHEIYGRCRLNPMIVLIRKKLLDKIPDRHFGAKNWKAGEKISVLNDWVSETDECTDTFGYVGLQLLKLTDNLRLISICQDGLFHAASLSSWMITYSQREPIYEPDQHFEDRLSWWYWLATRFGDEYPDKEATKKHIEKLLKFGEVNKLPKETLEKHQEMVFAKYPALKL